MGRQVNFYMLPEDLAEFELMLRDHGGVLFISDNSPTAQVQFLETLQIPDLGRTNLKLHLARAADLERIITVPIPARQIWTISEDRSWVVELFRCFYDGTVVRRGRLYYVPAYYDSEDQLVKKGQDFCEWADRLLRWIRNHYKRGSRDGYVGPYALKWISEGKGCVSSTTKG